MATYLGFAVALISLLALIGWPMPVEGRTAAIALLLSGASLTIGGRDAFWKPAATILALASGLMGLIGGLDPASHFPLVGSLIFVLTGAALVAAHQRGGTNTVQIPAALASFLTLLNILDSLFAGAEASPREVFRPLPWNFSLAFALICFGIYVRRPDEGLMLAWRRKGLIGNLARWLFPSTALGLLALAWLRLEGQRAGLFGVEFGVALLTSTELAILVGLISWSLAATAHGEANYAKTRDALLAQHDLVRHQSELINESNDAIITMDLNRVIVGWNRGAEKLYGWRSEEALGNVVHRFLQTRSSESVAAMDRQLKERGQWDGELQHVRKDGKTVVLDSRQVRLQIVGEHPAAILEINRDITARLQLEEQLRQTQKLDSIGQLAGGVAHDFNNHLSIVMGYAYLLLEEPDLKPQWRTIVREIADAADRSASVTRQLLLFSRRETSPASNVVLNEIVRGMEKMLRRLIGENVALKLTLDSVPRVVHINSGHLDQILMNLVINARDAMPGGGAVTIETSHMEVDREYAAAHAGVEEGAYVMLSVSDTGAGMTAEVKDHIFEPFFTTKKAGKGTGLGLSTVYGIVKQRKGSILVYSEVGKGTTFKILLPVSGAEADQTLQLVPEHAVRGTETILLAEDDESLRNYISQVLRRRGYQILVAANGREALGLATSRDRAVDLVLTDVIMPELGGVDFVDRFSKLFPGVPVLFMSGYTGQAVRVESMRFVQKPFTPATLLGHVRAALDAGH